MKVPLFRQADCPFCNRANLGKASFSDVCLWHCFTTWFGVMVLLAHRRFPLLQAFCRGRER